MVAVEVIIRHESLQIMEIWHSSSDVQGELQGLYRVDNNIRILMKHIVQGTEWHKLTNHHQIWNK